MDYFLSIDAGTSVIKVVIFDQNFKIKFKQSSQNQIITNILGKSEIDMRLSHPNS